MSDNPNILRAELLAEEFANPRDHFMSEEYQALRPESRAAVPWVGFVAMCTGMFMAILDVQVIGNVVAHHSVCIEHRSRSDELDTDRLSDRRDRRRSR